MKRKRIKKNNVKLPPAQNNVAPSFSFENNDGDNKRRFENTRRKKMEMQRLEREELERKMRLEYRREKFSDHEWDVMREEKLRKQAERSSTIVESQKIVEKNDEEQGQSDFYSGLDYRSDSISDVSQNFHTLRRENGKFGSHPDEDSYGDESNS